MKQPIIVHPAESSDSLSLYAMQRSLAYYCDYDMEKFGLTEEHIKKTIETDDQAHYFIAKHFDNKLGMMLCHRIPLSWRGTSGVYVEDLYVKDRFRHGMGVGKLLIKQACKLAVEYADEPENAFIRLDTHLADNEDTLRFYRRLGMEEDNVNLRLAGQAVLDLANTIPSGPVETQNFEI